MITEKAERSQRRKNKQTMLPIDMKTREIEEAFVDVDYRVGADGFPRHPDERPAEDVELTPCSQCEALGHRQVKYTANSTTVKWVHVVRIKASRKGARLQSMEECVVPE